jgi:hypothetical protein
MSGTDVSQRYDCDSDAPETDMIDDDTRRGPMKGAWLTELVRHHIHDLSGMPWRHPPDVSLGLGNGWHVSHLGNIQLVTRRHRIAVILKAAGPDLGDLKAPDLSLRLPIGYWPCMNSPSRHPSGR